MTQQFARVPVDAGEVVREVRGFGGVRGHACSATCDPTSRSFAVAIVALLVGSASGCCSRSSSPGSRARWSPVAIPAALDRLILVLVGLFCVQAVASFVQTWLLGVVGERVVAQLRGELYGRLVTLSLDFYGRRRVGELVSRLSSDVTLVRTMLTQTITSLLSSVIGLVGSVVILFTLSPTLLLVVLLLAPALIAVAIVFGRPLQRVSTPGAGHDRPQHDDRRGGALRASGSSRATSARTGSSTATTPTSQGVVAAGSRLALWRAGFGAVMGLLGFGSIAALLWYTGHQVIDGQLGVGTLTGFLLYGVAIGSEPRDDRRPLRAVPRGNRRRDAGLRDHRHAADHPRRARRRADRPRRGADHIRGVTFG